LAGGAAVTVASTRSMGCCAGLPGPLLAPLLCGGGGTITGVHHVLGCCRAQAHTASPSRNWVTRATPPLLPKNQSSHAEVFTPRWMISREQQQKGLCRGRAEAAGLRRTLLPGTRSCATPRVREQLHAARPARRAWWTVVSGLDHAFLGSASGVMQTQGSSAAQKLANCCTHGKSPSLTVKGGHGSAAAQLGTCSVP
jgi:hypothetical protein